MLVFYKKVNHEEKNVILIFNKPNIPHPKISESTHRIELISLQFLFYFVIHVYAQFTYIIYGSNIKFLEAFLTHNNSAFLIQIEIKQKKRF